MRRAFPGVIGFTAGWLLWFAYTVACSLYALGFAGYFWEFFLKYLQGSPTSPSARSPSTARSWA